ncbi:MAG: ATP-binding protein [Pseudomonadota bacterium]|nr:ATP-binding protein [Pseudomonadota bacterium]
MVFIGGPRQVGKTTLAKHLLKIHYPSGEYFNWDYDEDRQSIINKKWRSDAKCLVFDELHKFPKWKTWLKGVYDVLGVNHSFLITGSARLDVYRKGGDSLLGRYHYWRLHPFTIDELPAGVSPEEGFNRLMTVGGFPEPFLENDAREARRWRRERFDRIIREDIRDLESVRNLQELSLFLDLLRSRVGGLVTLSNLANDVQVSYKTAKNWLDILERMYLLFPVRPYTGSLPRAIQKPPKVYFFDNGDVLGDKGAIFENFVATTLIKRLHYMEDRDGYRYELRYIRDKEGREIDFVILKEGQIEELIEVKYSDEKPSTHLRYYAGKLNPPKATQLVATLKKPFDANGIRLTNPFAYFDPSFYVPIISIK